MMTFYFLILLNFFLVSSSGPLLNLNKHLINAHEKLTGKLQNSKTVLIGFGNLNLDDMIFWAKVYFKEGDANTTIQIPCEVRFRNSTHVKIKSNCSIYELQNQESSSSYSLYNCTIPIPNDNVTNVKFDNDNNLDFELSSFAETTKNNFSGNNEMLSREFTIFKNATLIKKGPKNFEIKGNMSNLDDSKDIKLVIQKNGIQKLLSCKGSEINDDSNNYSLECTSDEVLKTNLNNSYGYYNDIEKNKDFIVIFNETNSSNLEYYDYIPRVKKSGMSTGGIIAVIIPSVIVLLGVAALVFALRGRNPTPPLKDIAGANNTVGVAGMASSEAVVHQ